MCFSGALLGDNTINTLSGSWFVDKTAGLFTFLSANNQHRTVILPICLEIRKVYGNGLAMLGIFKIILVFHQRYHGLMIL